MRDPCVYLIMCLDTNLEVTYSTTHLFDAQGDIIRTRVCHGDHQRLPMDELDHQLDWGADQLNDFFIDLLPGSAT